MWVFCNNFSSIRRNKKKYKEIFEIQEEQILIEHINPTKEDGVSPIYKTIKEEIEFLPFRLLQVTLGPLGWGLLYLDKEAILNSQSKLVKCGN